MIICHIVLTQVRESDKVLIYRIAPKCRITFFRLLATERKNSNPYPSLALHTSPYHAGTVTKFG